MAKKKKRVFVVTSTNEIAEDEFKRLLVEELKRQNEIMIKKNAKLNKKTN